VWVGRRLEVTGAGVASPGQFGCPVPSGWFVCRIVSYTQAPKSAQLANPPTHPAPARPLTSPRARPGNWYPTSSIHPSPTRIHLHAPLSPSVSGSRGDNSRDAAAGTATRLSGGGRGGLSSSTHARHLPPSASACTLPIASSWWEV
jgi:hypothetical protein